jgi:hypothetical protein
LPIAIFGLLGIGYYIGLVIGSILVLVSVLVCFEIVRRATYFRAVFGIKGGKEEVEKIYPYNQMQNRNSRIIFAIFCHIITVMIIIGLMMLIVFAEIISEL